MEKYKGKYRIPSARWVTWDYGSNAAYFVTICIHDRSHGFGEIVNGEIILTSLGYAAMDCWNEIPIHFPFVELDGFIVMPNHVHGIIIIDKLDGDTVETQNIASLPQHTAPSQMQTQNIASLPQHAAPSQMQTQNIASLPQHTTPSQIQTQNIASLQPRNRFGPQSQNLASIVRGYKIGVTKFARQNNIPFAWQTRYHDHVIRNADEYARILKYIDENPQKWPDDTYHTM